MQEVEDLLHQLAEAQAFLAPLCGFHASPEASSRSHSGRDARQMEALFLGIQSRVT